MMNSPALRASCVAGGASCFDKALCRYNDDCREQSLRVDPERPAHNRILTPRARRFNPHLHLYSFRTRMKYEQPRVHGQSDLSVFSPQYTLFGHLTWFHRNVVSTFSFTFDLEYSEQLIQDAKTLDIEGRGRLGMTAY